MSVPCWFAQYTGLAPEEEYFNEMSQIWMPLNNLVVSDQQLHDGGDGPSFGLSRDAFSTSAKSWQGSWPESLEIQPLSPCSLAPLLRCSERVREDLWRTGSTRTTVAPFAYYLKD